ncbi:MAG: radical SAM protein [Phycisphaerae bacterium]
MPVCAPLRTTPQDVMPILRLHPEYLAPAKLGNFERLQDAMECGALTFDAAPAYVRLEPHAACNLRCCWAQANPKHPGLRPRGAMSVDLARRIVDELGDVLYQAILCHWGEPTLNPSFPEIARVFHDTRIATVVHSNMTLIDRPMADRIVASGLDEISGSIDGVAQEAYSKYRVLGKVDRAIAGLREVIEARRRAGRRTPLIAWQFLVFPHNVHEVATARRMAADLGVDEFRCFGAGGRHYDEATGTLTPRVTPPRPEVLCADPWRYVAVDWDGAVHLCCRAFKAEHVMGDLREAPLREVFQNERFQLARRVIRDGYMPAEDERTTCTGCSLVTDHVPELRALGHKTSLDDQG